jgi:hypothetical protein
VLQQKPFSKSSARRPSSNIVMSERRPLPSDLPATTDPVSVCFADRRIGELFIELLRARGVCAESIEDFGVLAAETRIITEPSFLPALPQCLLPRTLLVGNCSPASAGTALVLTRPLTEDKVERALRSFLR